MKFTIYFLLTLIAGAAAGAIIWIIIDHTSHDSKGNQPETAGVVMYKNPGCQCCDKWAG